MKGGRNLSLAGALVSDVYRDIAGILDEAGLLVPRERRGSTEDGLSFSGNEVVENIPPTPLTYHTSKSPKGRASLENLEDRLNRIQQELDALMQEASPA